LLVDDPPRLDRGDRRLHDRGLRPLAVMRRGVIAIATRGRCVVAPEIRFVQMSSRRPTSVSAAP